jgi:hypothetical protein
MNSPQKPAQLPTTIAQTELEAALPRRPHAHIWLYALGNPGKMQPEVTIG